MKKIFCEDCGEQILKAQIHHKDRNHSNNKPNNLKRLCRKCHGKEHGHEGASVSSFNYDLVAEISSRNTGQRLRDGFQMLGH